MVDSNTIIIVLLCILIFLYLLDMYKRDYFSGISGVAGTFFNVDYQTQSVLCDDLTGTYPCVVKTVKPIRKEVCNKKYNFISPNKRIGNNINQANQANQANQVNQVNQVNQANQANQDIENEMGMSLDQLDDLESNMNSFDDNNDDDDVNYDLDELKEKKNLKVKSLINSNKQYDTNTLSDVDEELMSLNN